MRLAPKPEHPRWFATVLVNTALVQVVVLVLRPTISYRALELGVPSAWLGALSATFALVPLIAAVIVGRVVDKAKVWPALAAGPVVLMVASIILAFAGGSLTGLIAGNAVLGLGTLIASVGQQSSVARFAPPTRRVAYFGYYALAASAGQALGPLLSTAVSGSANEPTEKIFTGAVWLSSMLVVWSALIRPQKDPGPNVVNGPRDRLLDTLRTPGLRQAILISLSVLAAVDLLTVYLPALGTDRRLSASVINVMLSVRAVAAIVSRFLLGVLVHRFGRRRTLVLALVSSALSIAVIALASSIPLLIAAIAIAGMALGLGQPVTMAWVVETADPRVRATALSVRLAGNRLGQTVIPVAAGATAMWSGTSGVLLIVAVWLTAVTVAAR